MITLAMFTPGMTVVILVILLSMFLARKLPELARALGRAMKDDEDKD